MKINFYSFLNGNKIQQKQKTELEVVLDRHDVPLFAYDFANEMAKYFGYKTIWSHKIILNLMSRKFRGESKNLENWYVNNFLFQFQNFKNLENWILINKNENQKYKDFYQLFLAEILDFLNQNNPNMIDMDFLETIFNDQLPINKPFHYRENKYNYLWLVVSSYYIDTTLKLVFDRLLFILETEEKILFRFNKASSGFIS